MPYVWNDREGTGIAARLRALWCDWTHGGGKIQRDSLGRINWRCSKCGRWSVPIELADEAAAFCAETGQHKDPRGCWNVRCQLSGQCCRAEPATQQEPYL